MVSMIVIVYGKKMDEYEAYGYVMELLCFWILIYQNCVAYPYVDPYFCGLVTAYGGQAMVG